MAKNKTKANAAFWFAADGYDSGKGLNGRRIAGASFLKAFVKHADVDSYSCLALNDTSHKIFRQMVRDLGGKHPFRHNYLAHSDLPAGIDNVYIPSPNLADESWRRLQQGSDSYSISGVTHTICTDRITKSFNDMQYSPVEEWDGVICTSKAVHDSLSYQLNLIEEYSKKRFGKSPKRYQMPIIPLGVHQDDYTLNQAHRKKWRDKLGIATKDIVVVTFARLASFEKFDPIPLFIALQNASKDFKHKVHLIAVGPYSDNIARRMYEQGMKNLARDVTYHHIDGAVDKHANETWSAADIFTLPVDNIQETFGLAPVEAMSMGLPVVVSDWNGFRDTVTTDCGFLVRTTAMPAGSGMAEARRYQTNKDNYNQYIGTVSQMTSLDIRQMTEAFKTLIHSPDIRKKMGQAGQKRVKSVYDWSNIIPQYQEFWGELSAIRKHAIAKKQGISQSQMPHYPDPTSLFENYATEVVKGKSKYSAVKQSHPENIINWFIKLRGLDALKRKPISTREYLMVFNALQGKDSMTVAQLVKACKPMQKLRVMRALIWFTKYGLATKLS